MLSGVWLWVLDSSYEWAGGAGGWPGGGRFALVGARSGGRPSRPRAGVGCGRFAPARRRFVVKGLKGLSRDQTSPHLQCVGTVRKTVAFLWEF
jgi:hypothetical protein